jgi:tight adherence protein C
MAWLLMAILLLLAAALLIAGQWRVQQQQQLISRRLQGGEHIEQQASARQQWLQRLGRNPLMVRLLNLDSETALLLNRIGWRRGNQRALFVVSQLLMPLLLLALVLVGQALVDAQPRQPWLLPMLAVGAGFLLPKRLLVLAASKRQRQLVAEISTFIPLLRILFDAGLTVEQSLRVLSEQGRKLMPVLCGELAALLKRVDSGLELGEELQQLSSLLDVDELSDCLTILQQLLRQGGGAMSSLAALKKLLDDRRLTGMQEYISKLSAKLSVVMMVFLFPALLIVLAGPGLSAIGRALGSAG